LRQAPGLNRDGLVGAAVYFDAQVEYAERLVLENVLSAVEHGAIVKTYAPVEKLIIQAGKVCGVEFTDQSPTSKVQSPKSGVQDEFFQLEGGGRATSTALSPRNAATAPIVINAAGPWIDQVLGASSPDSSRLIGGTKGSHLIVGPFAGAPDSAIYVEAETDRRPFFIIPWNGNYLIGTTDIRYDGNPDNVRIETREIEYLLRETNRVIPEGQLTRAEILYTYSGVRPLPFVNKKEEQSITRRHFIRAAPHVENLYSIVGGKLTTYRSLAEETVDLIFKKLGRVKPPCTTDRMALPGAMVQLGVGEPAELPQATNERLTRIYGTRSSAVGELIRNDPTLAEVFDSETGAIAAEVVFAFKYELARTLSDCLLRRTMVGLNSNCGLNAVEAAAGIAQKHLGWSASRAEREIFAYRTNRKANC
jgi:glycerol-3-phosphate dehydrogenase